MTNNFQSLPFQSYIYNWIQNETIFYEPYNNNMGNFGNDSTLIMINICDIWEIMGMMLGFFLLYRIGLLIFVKSNLTRFKM